LVLCGQQITFAVDTGTTKVQRESRQQVCKKWLKTHWKKVAVAAAAVAACGGCYVLYRITRPAAQQNMGTSPSPSVRAPFEHDQSRARRSHGDDEAVFVPAFRHGDVSGEIPVGGCIVLKLDQPEGDDLKMDVQKMQERIEQNMAEVLRRLILPEDLRWHARVRCHELDDEYVQLTILLGEQEYLDYMQQNANLFFTGSLDIPIK